jgi:hypothetical protein
MFGIKVYCGDSESSKFWQPLSQTKEFSLFGIDFTEMVPKDNAHVHVLLVLKGNSVTNG